MKAIEAFGLEKNFGNFNLKLDMALNKGEILGFVGPNGAGKTTFLNILLNIVKKDSGQVRIFGLDHIKHESKIKEKIGVVFEEQNFYKNARIEYLLKFCSAFYPHWNWGKVALLRKKFKLNENLKFMQLSRGMKVKLALIIAISIEAELLILDEPFAGIDPIAVAEIQGIIRNLALRGLGVLITDHSVRETLAITDRAYIMYDGRVLISGSAQELADDPEARKIYLGERFTL